MDDRCKSKILRYALTGLISEFLILASGMVTSQAQGPIPQQTQTTRTRQGNFTEIPIVRTVSMNVHYQIQKVRWEDLERVELWYGQGVAGSWQLYDFDHDKRSPIRFTAPGEGIYRFLVIAQDRWGRRSCENDGINRAIKSNTAPEGAPPHLVVYIDYITPRLYLYRPWGEMKDFNQSELEFRWAGFDSNLDVKPVRLFYQPTGSDTWTVIGGPFEANGEFTWRIPVDLKGSIQTKAVLTDRAGHYDVQYSGIIHLSENRPVEKTVQAHLIDPGIVPPEKDANKEEDKEENHPIRIETSLRDQEIRRQTARHILRGNLHVERREWQDAIHAFEAALNIDPCNIEARTDLAGVLLLTGDFGKAKVQYGLCLDLDETFITAWYGQAQALIALQDYEPAQKALEKLLQLDSEDWQCWYLHGNVAEKLHQTDVARNSWEKAARDNSPVRDLALAALERIKKNQR